MSEGDDPQRLRRSIQQVSQQNLLYIPPDVQVYKLSVGSALDFELWDLILPNSTVNQENLHIALFCFLVEEIGMMDGLWYVECFNFFPAMSKEEMETLLKTTEVRSIRKGDAIYFPGDPADYAYLIKEGHVRISRISPEGKLLTLDILEPGNIFGEMVVAGQQRRSEIAEAMEDCALCVVPRSVLMSLVEANAKMALHITKIIGLRREKIESRIENLLFCPVSVRLARLFLGLADHYPGRTTEGYRMIDLRLTHQEIGSLIGTNREIVTVTLNRLKQQGLLVSLQHKIILMDEAQLTQLAGGPAQSR